MYQGYAFLKGHKKLKFDLRYVDGKSPEDKLSG